MGDPKKPKKKYKTPSHPWEKARIDAEKIITRDYGLKNKKEIWKASSMLGRFKDQAKKCATLTNNQIIKEKAQLLKRLQTMGLIQSKDGLDEVLGLTLEKFLDRRLQTMVYKKKLVSTIKQARQFIVHGHVNLNGKKVTIPGYFVKLSEEDQLSLDPEISKVVAMKKEVKNE